MIVDYYQLREEPFGVTPDAHYLYASPTHREALASVLYGVEAGRGFVALIAMPGMGKTTLLYQALHRLREKARTVFLFQTMGTPEDFLRALLADLGVHEGVHATQGTLIELQSKLNEVLVAQSRLGKPLVIVIDEAQNLDGSVLELVRMLSNFETSREKLMQIILSGQPQLADKLASPELVQLRQRVSIVASLKPFSPEETALYIDHRLRTAGYSADAPLFTGPALALIADRSEGIPRNINNLCFHALSLGCALKRSTIDGEIVREVIADLDLEPLRKRRSLAAQPEKEDGQEILAFAGARAKPWPARWLPKVSVAGVILLALAGALFASPHLRSDRSALADATVRADSIVPALVPVMPSSLGTNPSQQPTDAANAIRVTPGQTLYRICVETFGRCTPEHLQEIHRLNPRLNNLDHIESGQKLRVPIAQQFSGATQDIVQQPDNASLPEKNTP